MRRSTAFLILTAFNAAFFVFVLIHERYSQVKEREEGLIRARIMKELRLTDLCLFTEARYTRNPSLSDIQSPFQDHPAALEHFPSGSLATPPYLKMRKHAQPS